VPHKTFSGTVLSGGTATSPRRTVSLWSSGGGVNASGSGGVHPGPGQNVSVMAARHLTLELPQRQRRPPLPPPRRPRQRPQQVPPAHADEDPLKKKGTGTVLPGGSDGFGYSAQGISPSNYRTRPTQFTGNAPIDVYPFCRSCAFLAQSKHVRLELGFIGVRQGTTSQEKSDRSVKRRGPTPQITGLAGGLVPFICLANGNRFRTETGCWSIAECPTVTG